MTTTNETTREAVLRMEDEGHTISDTACVLNVTPQSVYAHRRNRHVEPQRRVPRRVDAGTTQARCLDCGRPTSSYATNGVRILRCKPCHQAKLTREFEVVQQQRRRRLLEYGVATGYVPTCRVAMQLLGVGRSVAGTVILDTFGPDPRDGHHRHSPRPMPSVLLRRGDHAERTAPASGE